MCRLLLILMAIALFSCDKNVYPSYTYGKLSVNISYKIDDKPLVWDSMMYKNEAGNKYSISRLQYYLGNFKFYDNNVLVQEVDTVLYVDANDDATCKLLFPSLKVGIYDSIGFTIGVPAGLNISNGLPLTINNANMAWPDAMGGGYHFLKLEGHWKDTSGILGYAMHVGKNDFQGNAGVKCNLVIKGNTETQANIKMNINEWFRNPNIYNFATDGVYSMGNTTLMQKIIQNGRDVFTAL